MYICMARIHCLQRYANFAKYNGQEQGKYMRFLTVNDDSPNIAAEARCRNSWRIPAAR